MSISEPVKLIKCLHFLKHTKQYFNHIQEIIHFQEAFLETSSASRLPNMFSASISVLENNTQFWFLLPNRPTISWKSFSKQTGNDPP